MNSNSNIISQESNKSFFRSISDKILNRKSENPQENNTENNSPSFKQKIITLFEVEKSYTYFFIVLIIGILVLFLSLIFLPMIVISPQKFISLFSLGSLIVISSFIFIYGTEAFCSKIFDTSRRFWAVIYLFSIILGMYFSFMKSFILISYICSVFQLITLICFVLSFLPGGQSGIRFIIGSIKSIFIKS